MNKKFRYLLVAAMVFIIALVACEHKLTGIKVAQLQADGTEAPIINAGETAEFHVYGYMDNYGDRSNERLIMVMLAPKCWDVRNRATVTYVADGVSDGVTVMTMSAIPEETLPKNGGGATWHQRCYSKYGVGSNVLNDMEWVAFWSDDLWQLSNGEKSNYDITIKLPVDMQNLRCRLSFIINSVDDGLSWDTAYYGMAESEPFRVINGEGAEIDYSSFHFNAAEPMESTQNDIITFSFNAEVGANNLLGGDVYFEAKATTTDGAVYVVNEKSESTLMKKLDYSPTYKKTIWPGGFFAIPDGKIISKIEYRFTDVSGDYIVDKYVDNVVSGEADLGEPDTWFELSMAKQ